MRYFFPCLLTFCLFLFSLIFFVCSVCFSISGNDQRDNDDIVASSSSCSSKSRSQSNVNPPALNLSSSSSFPPAAALQRASSPKSPIVEVSPYRRWSEAATASLEADVGRAKVSNEWQSNFERSYIELEELGRGRFSVVRRCQEIMTGNEVAVKFVNRKKQDEVDTLREYRHLAALKYPYLIASRGLYLTSNSYAIVMTL